MSTGPSSPADKAPFIANQGMRLLREQRQPKQYVGSSAFAAERKNNDERGRGGGNPGEPAGHWEHISRDQVALQMDPDMDLHRTVVVNDAGLGKSTTARWLRYEYSRASSDKLAFVVEISDLKEIAEIRAQSQHHQPLHQMFVEWMLQDQISLAGTEPLRRLIEAGRVVLVFDGLDQAPDNAIGILARLLHDAFWAKCRIVLTSRPYALDQHWEKLFNSKDEAPGWRFVRLDEFTEPQQQAYLGNERFNCIPKNAREILTVPRVLYYLRKLTVAELSKVRTTSDVYDLATQKMIVDGLAAAHASGLNPKRARRLLSIIAFHMVTEGANFNALSGSGAVTGLQSAIGRYCVAYDARGQTDEKRIELVKEYNGDWVEKRLEELAAMNDILDCGLLERGCPNHYQFRNTSLQEFFAAQFLSSYCTESALPQIESMLHWEASPDSRKYRNVWRMFAEMPFTAHDADSWLTAASVLYRRGTGKAETTRRSTEMIYHTWSVVETYEQSSIPAVQAQARNLLSSFQGEFSRMLSARHIFTGKWGLWRWWVARRFVAGFRSILAGEFTMGSPAGEEGRGSDEVQHLVRITRAFQMHRYQVTNAKYELFDPGHRAKRDKISDANAQPVVYVSWYDAWCFSKWLWFDGQCCRLPTEAEWEYSCRAGTTTRFWSGDADNDLDRASWYSHNSNNTTHPVGKKAANAWGLYDTHGNVSEWCADWYGPYSGGSKEDPSGPKTGDSRVLRGGSHLLDPQILRSAYRSDRAPVNRYFSYGFRISRTP